MRRLLLPLLLAFTAVNAHAQDKRLAGIDTFIQRVLKEWKAVGVAVAVVEKNKVVLSKGYGYRDLDKKLPATDETLFAIGSCTKAFTSALLGILANDGKLDLDKPVSNYLTDLRFYNDALTAQVTTKDMMSHRTGLPRHDLAWYGSPSSRDSLMHRIRYFEPSATLRERWQYNNFMFLAQGYLAERLSGSSWENLLLQRILSPLGMKSSSPSISAMQTGSNASIGYRVEKDSLIKKMAYMNIDAMGPAGSINSNVKEMSQWVITWIHGGKYQGKEILPASYVTQATSSQMVIGPALPTKENPDVHLSNYGMGWFLSSYRGHYRVDHGGNIDGFSANTCFFPSDSIGIVVLVNQNGSPIPGIIRNTISDRMLGLAYRDWNGLQLANARKNKAAQKEKAAADSAIRKQGTKPTHSLAEYAGTYTHPGYGTLQVNKVGDSLMASYGKLNMVLRHYHYDVFKALQIEDGVTQDEGEGMKFSFTMNEKGDISSVNVPLEQAVAPIAMAKQLKKIALSKTDLEKYTGEYEIQGAAVKIYLRADNTLMASVPGQPEYELVPIGNHEFNIKALSGYSIVFDAGADQKVTGLKFVQPNGIFKANKKSN